MKIKYFILFLLSSLNLYAQEEKVKKFQLNPWENRNGYRVATNFLKDYEAEVSYLITSFPKQPPSTADFLVMRAQYIGLGMEYLRLGNKNIIGFKVSYEESFNLFAAQIGADYLTTFDDSQFRVTPKVGLSIAGFMTMYYGWNFDLSKSSSIQTRNQFISLQINVIDI